jgi:hypothetical protein
MTRIKYLIISSLVIFLSIFLINYLGLIGQPDEASQADADSDLPEESEIMEEDELEAEEVDEEDVDQEQTGGTVSTSQPSSTFQHKVEMKVDGVVEKDKGDKWWVID